MIFGRSSKHTWRCTVYQVLHRALKDGRSAARFGAVEMQAKL